MAFSKATREKAKLRLAISGPSGSGKTKTALRIASVFGKVALLDSEHGSSSKYAGSHDFDMDAIPFDSHPMVYIKAIEEAERDGYDVLIIDSLTHAWEATKNEVDKKKQADKYGNGFTAWKVGTEIWNQLINRIESSSINIIATMRSKVEYAQDVQDGKKVIKKLGMAPEVREGTEYVFDAVLEIEVDHSARIGKTRCELLDGFCEVKPGENLGNTLKTWLHDGIEPAKKIDPKKARAIAMAREAGFDEKTICLYLNTNDWQSAPEEAYKALCEQIKLAKEPGATK